MGPPLSHCDDYKNPLWVAIGSETRDTFSRNVSNADATGGVWFSSPGVECKEKERGYRLQILMQQQELPLVCGLRAILNHKHAVQVEQDQDFRKLYRHSCSPCAFSHCKNFG